MTIRDLGRQLRSAARMLPRYLARLRGLFGAQRLRLASGLILFVFAASHFLNHALGLVSLEAMEIGQTWRWKIQRTNLGTAVLYAAFALHIGLGVKRLLALRTWRIPALEAGQFLLGLAIPILLVPHVMFTRAANAVYGLPDFYITELKLLWPDAAAQQSILLLIVWLHACIGLHYWLRLRPWYHRASQVLLVLAVLVPVLALAGFATGAREAARTISTLPELTAEQRAQLELYSDYARAAYTGLGALLVAALAWPTLLSLRQNRIAVRYSGGREVRVVPGPTLLEISRAAGIPHASVCGGRARCSTCRVAVGEGLEQLDLPSPAEQVVLARIGAPSGVRLACQTRPRASVSVRPLVPVHEAGALAVAMRDPYRWGVEHRVTVLFADLRQFTSFAERHYAYDVVFLLNRYFRLMSEAVQANRGLVDKFIGDGVMAIFGVTATQWAGSRDALLAARSMERALRTLNDEFEPVLSEPMRMGIGIHTGPAILGRVGVTAQRGSHSVVTALGDTVNIASRLEGASKEFSCLAVVSEDTATASGIPLEGAVPHELVVRGRQTPLTVYAIRDLGILAGERWREAAPA